MKSILRLLAVAAAVVIPSWTAKADVTHYRSAVLSEPALLSFYPFDGDTAPKVLDTIPPLQNGTLVGATLSTALGTVGAKSVQGSRVALGVARDYEFTNGIGTIEMFLYQTGTAAYNPCFFSSRDDSQSPSTRYSLHAGAGGNQLFLYNGSAAPVVNTPISMLNKLVHVAYVFEPGVVTVYFNGGLIATWQIDPGPAKGISFQIGSSGPSSQEAWVGRIDEVALYSEALPAIAIASHAAAWVNTQTGLAPVLTSVPVSRSFVPGETIPLQVQLKDPAGARYRWQQDGSPIPNATNATLTLGPLAAGDDNKHFRCIIYNVFGATNTPEITLSLQAPPSILSQPEDSVQQQGSSLSLDVTATGTPPLRYQWFLNDSPIEAATNASLPFASLAPTHSGVYFVSITNAFGGLQSRKSQLSVVPVVILSPPQNIARFAGQAAHFSVTATSASPLTYQWFQGEHLLLNETNSILSLPAVTEGTAGPYSVRVSSSQGTTNSAPGTLTVLRPETPQTIATFPPFERLPQSGDTSSDAVVQFNEIMYHGRPGETNLQWIELQNVMRVDVDISRWHLEDGVYYTFPEKTIIPGGGFVVVAKDPAAFTQATGQSTPFGPFTNTLSHSGATLTLRNHDGRLMDVMTYGDEQPWPEGADGSGASLSKIKMFGASAEPVAWTYSPNLGGTPGAPNIPSPSLPRLALNEIQASTNPVARVELLNYGASPLSLAGISLQVLHSNTAVNVALPSITLEPGAFQVLEEAQLGIHPALNDKLFLLTSNQTLILSAATVKSHPLARFPDGVGPWQHPSQDSFGYSNVVTINRDIVINEILYEASPAYPSGVYAPSSEGWVELYNRGTQAVSLAGWRFDGGIRFSFPVNTLLQPGGYLVVAKDAATLSAARPGLNALGNYSGQLSRSTDLIQLKDALGNVVNEVRYYSGGRWPDYASGGGSSLELVDPYADNRLPESWAASDTASQSAWQTIRYRGIASSNRGYDIGDNIWNELVLGLLDAGEFLLDDVSVIELPGTAQARQLIQNGSFESDTVGGLPSKWRVIGTHGLHGRTRVEIDPANAANKVLHVTASGPTDIMHNQLSTTLKSGNTSVSVVSGRDYEISFRVRWLGGARLLNSRLYANWLQRTTVLEVPPLAGTPGRLNSGRLATAGPTYGHLSHTPVVPPAGSPVTIAIDAYDPQGVSSMSLRWRTDGGTWSRATMIPDATGSRYAGIIPPQPKGTRIQFYVVGRDAWGAESMFPSGGPESRALLIFADGKAAPAPTLTLRMLMTESDTATLYLNTNRMSNHRFGATVIYNEDEVYYDVGVRLKGSAFGRNNDTETGLSIDFDPDRKFRGAHDSISIERGAGKREILARHLFNQAGGGVTAGYDDIAHILTPRPQDAGRCFLSMTRTSDTLLDTQYGGGGTVYNLELLYTPNSTVNGNPETPKLNFPYVHDFGAPDFQDLGDDKETYRWNFQPRNNRTRDDLAPVMALCKAFELTGAALDSRTRQIMDVDQWLRCFAMQSLVGNDDTYTRLYNHNFRMYQRPRDNRLVALPWDLDRAFNIATTGPLWGSDPDAFGLPTRMKKVIEYPGNLRIYYLQLLDLLNGAYNVDDATRWANHFADLMGDANLRTYPSYVAARASYVRSQIPSNPAFSITTSNGLPFVVSSNWVTVSGTAPFSVRWMTVNGLRYDPVWTSASAWSLRLALPQGSQVIRVDGFDVNGVPVPGATGSTTITVNAAPEDPLGTVVINEINYNPPLPSAEFVELFNTSFNTAYDLLGWQINGVGLTFDRSTVIPPRGFVVVAGAAASVAAAYGGNVQVAAEFTGHLDGAGETLSLFQSIDSNTPPRLIDRVRYEPGTPWPTNADGFGASLQLIDASQDNARVSNWTNGFGWRFFSLSGTADSSRLSIQFDSTGGDFFLDDVSLVPGSVPGTGVNSVVNGGFELPLAPAWKVAGISGGTHVTNGVSHSGSNSLHVIQLVGSPAATLLFQDVSPTVATNTSYTLSGWYLPGSRTNLTVRLGNGIQAKPNLRPNAPTPGASNLGVGSLPSYPNLWLNEVLSENINGAKDAAGDRDPWVELYNAGSTGISLDGVYLSDNYDQLDAWAFPPGFVVEPGSFLLVWCDGELGESGPNQLHTPFRLSPANGQVVLSRKTSAGLQIVDYLNYTALPKDQSYGSMPDGQAFFRGTMYYPTPSAANDLRSAPLRVLINEWMAANTSASGIADPADGQFEDWFELYNPEDRPVDIGGCYLTDTLSNKRQFAVPNNGHYVIPAKGFLLVWADGEPGQNSTNRADLHVNFSLRAAGEAIGLFAADGTQIDAVTFGSQTDNVSQGRSPDGANQILTLPFPSPGRSSALPESPQILSLSIGADHTVSLLLKTVSGYQYLVESLDDLGAGIWKASGGAVRATSSTLTLAAEPGAVGHRFYRVTVLP